MKFVVALEAHEKFSQTICIAYLEHPWMALPEEADGAINSGSENRSPCDASLTDDVGSTFHARRQDEQVAARNELPGSPMGMFAKPPVAGVFASFPRCRLLERRGDRLAHMIDLDLRRLGQAANRHCAAHGVLHRSKVSDNADPKTTRAGVLRGFDGDAALMNDVTLSTNWGREFGEPRTLKHDDSIGEFKRPPSAHIPRQAPIQIRSGESNDQGPLWMSAAVAAGGGRAFVRVHEHQNVGLFSDTGVLQVVRDVDSMPERANHTRPT